jgi:ribosome-binding protein aMBF1 (putative translation factor)
VSIGIGAAIRKARKNAGLRQADLAEKVGVDTSTVGRWESEKARPSDDHVSTVEDSLGLRRGEILIAAGLVGPTAIESARGELAHTVGARFERLTPKQKQLLLGILDEFEARSE